MVSRPNLNSSVPALGNFETLSTCLIFSPCRSCLRFLHPCSGISCEEFYSHSGSLLINVCTAPTGKPSIILPSVAGVSSDLPFHSPLSAPAEESHHDILAILLSASRQVHQERQLQQRSRQWIVNLTSDHPTPANLSTVSQLPPLNYSVTGITLRFFSSPL